MHLESTVRLFEPIPRHAFKRHFRLQLRATGSHRFSELIARNGKLPREATARGSDRVPGNIS
jgi:hypothetical protein